MRNSYFFRFYFRAQRIFRNFCITLVVGTQKSCSVRGFFTRLCQKRGILCMRLTFFREFFLCNSEKILLWHLEVFGCVCSEMKALWIIYCDAINRQYDFNGIYSSTQISLVDSQTDYNVCKSSKHIYFKNETVFSYLISLKKNFSSSISNREKKIVLVKNVEKKTTEIF